MADYPSQLLPAATRKTDIFIVPFRMTFSRVRRLRQGGGVRAHEFISTANSEHEVRAANAAENKHL